MIKVFVCADGASFIGDVVESKDLAEGELLVMRPMWIEAMPASEGRTSNKFSPLKKFAGGREILDEPVPINPFATISVYEPESGVIQSYESAMDRMRQIAMGLVAPQQQKPKIFL